MMTNDLKLLDETVYFIKQKNETHSYFSLKSLHKFEFCLFLSLDIVRFELQTQKHLSDSTADAISQLFAFGTFEYYYRDFPEIHKKCSELFVVLEKYNQDLKNHDLPGYLSTENDPWIDYFTKTISKLITIPT